MSEYLTTYTGANPVQDADPITGSQPDLDEVTTPGAGDGSDMRTTQVEKLRDKIHTACKLLGDSVNAPSGSLCDILDRDHANGDARQLRLRERASAPTAVADKATVYALDDGGVTKAYVRWSDGTDKEIGAGGATNTVSGGSGITNTGDNVDAVLEPTYGSLSNTVCEGDDSRLSDARTPTGSASGDLTGTYPGPTIDADAVGNTKLANMAQATVKGRAAAAGTGDPTDLSQTQLTALVNSFTDSLSGAAPASGGGSSNYLRADGTWNAPPGGSSSPLTTAGDIWGHDTGDARVPVGADNAVLTAASEEDLGVKYALVANSSLATQPQDTIKGRASGAGTGSPQNLTATQATAILNAFTDSLKGLAPASGGGTTNFLRADGSWAAPAGGGSLDRFAVFADDTEFGEAGTSYVTKKTFRIVRDSAKKNASWRLVVSLWIEGGGTSAECQLKVGATDAANVSSTETTETASSIKKIDLTVNESNEPENTFLDVDIDLKQTGGGTAKLKFTELYAIFT